MRRMDMHSPFRDLTTSGLAPYSVRPYCPYIYRDLKIRIKKKDYGALLRHYLFSSHILNNQTKPAATRTQ